jgi:hypothetical protein
VKKEFEIIRNRRQWYKMLVPVNCMLIVRNRTNGETNNHEQWHQKEAQAGFHKAYPVRFAKENGVG